MTWVCFSLGSVSVQRGAEALAGASRDGLLKGLHLAERALRHALFQTGAGG